MPESVDILLASPDGRTCVFQTEPPGRAREKLAACLCLAWLVAACGAVTATSPPSPSAAARGESLAAPASLVWVERSAEYEASVRQAYAVATRRVEQAAAGRQPGAWAVILDADDTVISNVQYQLERSRVGLGYTPDSWAAWVRRRAATPMPGAAAFLQRARSLGARVAIVTNRLESQCADTAAVFIRYALEFDAMLCQPDGTSSDKNPRFQAVSAGRTALGASPLEVVLYVGDNIADFPGLSQAIRGTGNPVLDEFGSRFVVIPNPMYGSWQ